VTAKSGEDKEKMRSNRNLEEINESKLPGEFGLQPEEYAAQRLQENLSSLVSVEDIGNTSSALHLRRHPCHEELENSN
jgi:hypothetical protein